MDIEEKVSGPKKAEDLSKLTQAQLLARCKEQETRIEALITSIQEKEERTRFLAVHLEELQKTLSVKIKNGGEGQVFQLKRPIEELNAAIRNLAQASGMPKAAGRRTYKEARRRASANRKHRQALSVASSGGYGFR